MRCQHCGSNFGSHEELQEHQIASCPAILSEDDSMLVPDDNEENESVQVIYKWLEDRTIPEQIDVIHLIISNLDINIPLNKGNGSFRSDWTEINVGTYCAQLVIDGEILPVAEFSVEQQTETVFIIIDREEDTNIESGSYGTVPQPTIDDSSTQDPHLTGAITSAIGELLSEEQFDVSHQQQRGDHDQFMSPEVATLQNVDNITSDNSHHRQQLSPTEHQQPLENDLRDDDDDTHRAFAQMSGNSTPRSDENITPRVNRQTPSVQSILHELSLTSPEIDQAASRPTGATNSLPQPQVRRQRSHDSSFHGDESFSLPADPVSPKIGDHGNKERRRRRNSDGGVNKRTPRSNEIKIEV